MTYPKTPDELIDRFAEGVGVEKATDLVSEALGDAGLEDVEAFDRTDVIFLCELIQENTQGYTAEFAVDTRARIEAHERFQKLFSHIPDPALIIQFDGGEPIIRNTNDEFEEAFIGDDVSDAQGTPLSAITKPEDEEVVAKAVQQLSQGQDIREEVQLETISEGTGYFNLKGTPHVTDQADQQAFVVCGDITEAKTREQQLKEREEDLEQSNAELEQFAYVASHDLQEPLRMISSYIDLIEMEIGDDLTEDGEEYMDFVTDGADRMKRLIDDLLKYSRVGTDEHDFEPIDLNGIADDVVQDLKFRIEDTDGEVNVETLPEIVADGGQMTQLFQNLISNALKYAGENTPPVVDVYVDEELPDQYRIAIEDNGEGIPEDQQERIFDVFTRGAEEDDDTGTGIGLAVCNRIVEGHGGSLTVESEIGDGTTFYFTLNKDGDDN